MIHLGKRNDTPEWSRTAQSVGNWYTTLIPKLIASTSCLFDMLVKTTPISTQVKETKSTSLLFQVYQRSLLLYVTFHRKRSTFQNDWRQSSGTKCTWTLTSNVLKSTPFPMERHIYANLTGRIEVEKLCLVNNGALKEKKYSRDVDVKVQVHTWTLMLTSWKILISYRMSQNE